MDRSLIGSLNDLFPEINFTIEKLKNLNQAIMLDLCKEFIIYLYDGSREPFVWKMTEQQKNRSSHPELLVDATEILNIFKIMNKVMAIIATKVEFHLVDIIKPETKRTIYFLKAIVNFRVFANQFIEKLIVPCVHKANKQGKEMNLLKEKVEMLNDNIERKITSINDLRAEIEKIIEEGNEETTILNDLKDKHRCLENEISELEDTRDQLDKKFIESKDAIEQLTAEKEKLRDQIYEDYPKIKGQYQKLLLKKCECESKIATEKIAHATIQERNEIFIRLEADFVELLDLVSKLEDAFSSNKLKKVEESRLEDLKEIYSKQSAHLTHRIEKCESERKSLLKELKHLNDEENARRLKEDEYLEKCNQMMDLLSVKEKEYKENVVCYEQLYRENLFKNEQLERTVNLIIQNIVNEKREGNQ